jgi:DNA-directed RNA polymerase specialized sigma24 family protein
MEGEAPEPGSDAEYLLRSLSEPEEFSILYARHSPAVFRFLARQTDRQAAEDLLAEVFLTAFRIRDRYDISVSVNRPEFSGDSFVWFSHAASG